MKPAALAAIDLIKDLLGPAQVETRLVSKSVGSVEWYRKNSLIVVWAYQEVGDLIAKESFLLLMLL